ncbi:MAG: glutamate racemase [Candidatus Nealsonbacteria bacterium]
MIGVFDSGVGGLTVVKEIFKQLPEYQIIYFGDTARLPYGTKGANFVKRYSEKITSWLLNKDAKIIVIACHTSSAWASNSLKKKFKKVPIFEMITSASQDVVDITQNKKIGIIGTPGTIKSKAFEKKLLELDSNLEIYSKSCPLFVSLAEEGWVDNKITKEIIKEYLEPLKNKGIDTLVLACTHYPLLEKAIKEVVGDINIINPAKSVAKEIKLFLENNPQIIAKIKKGKNHQFFFSDEPYNFEKISHLCFNKKLKIKINDPF